MLGCFPSAGHFGPRAPGVATGTGDEAKPSAAIRQCWPPPPPRPAFARAACTDEVATAPRPAFARVAFTDVAARRRD